MGKTHGECVSDKLSTEYVIWRNIKARCHNPNNTHYKNYGGRGITLHSAWINNFSAFLAYVGRRPSMSHTLDRIDNNKGYEPGNLRWVDRYAQANNKANNVIITYNGVSKTRAEWADFTGIPYFTIRRRLALGWSVEETLTKSLRADKRRKDKIIS